MSETKTPDGKTLSVGKSTLSLKPRTETGVVRQSFSHGRSKQVVVEVKKRRIPGPEVKPEAAAAAPAAAAPIAKRAAASAAKPATPASTPAAPTPATPSRRVSSRGFAGSAQRTDPVAAQQMRVVQRCGSPVS